MGFINRDREKVIQRCAPLPHDEWERIEAQVRRSVRVKDDFVQIPFPRLAAASGRQIVAAVESYKQQAAVIDPRLFRKVTLALKGAAIDDLCAALQAQTGVELRAARGVGDDKVTVFVKERPAREVMRAIVQLFGYVWLRSKKADGYRYELFQDLRSQLAEEELRNRDMSAALLALDREMQAYRPYLELSFDELQARYAHAREPERDRLRKLVKAGGWGGMQLYYRLTPAERAALLSGRPLAFSPDAPQPDRRLPAEWVRPIMRSIVSYPQPPEKPTSMADTPGVTLSRVSLQLDRSVLGQVMLSVTLNARDREGPTEQDWMRLADGPSPSMEKPDNARQNRELRSEGALREVVSVRPESSCPKLRLQKQDPGEKQTPHVFSADVWEAVHRATGESIVADYYTRLYPTGAVTLERAPLFDALCRVSDAMRARWRKEGDFLLCRSTSFFWDRVNEVPNRYLERWQQEKREHGGLPLESLLEMASLSDEQLSASALGESLGVGGAIIHCWGLDEWHLVATIPGYRVRPSPPGIYSYPPHGEVRYYRLIRPLGAQEPGHYLTREYWNPANLREELRFFGTLTPEQRQHALRPDGIALSELTLEQRRGFLQFWNELEEMRERYRGTGSAPAPHELLNARLSAEYIPSGWYFWAAPWKQPEEWARVPPRVAARTAAEALAAARRIDPEARPEQIHQCLDGDFTPSIWIGPLSPQEASR